MDMNRESFLKLLGVPLLVLALFSCTDKALDPVFYALEHETSLVDDRGFPDEAMVQRIVKYPVSPPTARYFAAASGLYTRTAAGNWKRMTDTPESSHALCYNVEIFNPGAGDELLAAFTLGKTGLGLWRRSPDLSDSWSQVSGLAADLDIGLLKTVGSYLFVGTLEGTAYHLYYSADLTTFLPATGITAELTTGAINDIAQYGAGNYWVSAGRKLWAAGSPGGPFAEDTGPTTSSPGNFKGLYYSSAGTGTLYLAAYGKYYTWDGATWTSSAAVEGDGKSAQITCFTELSGAPGTDILMGTSLYGYYDASTLTRSPSYTISSLYSGGILTMLFDGSSSPELLFLGTSNAGLWRGEFNSSSGTWSWKQE
jgi:hypothetical protein